MIVIETIKTIVLNICLSEFQKYLTRCGNIDLIYKNEILEISEMMIEISKSLKYDHLEISAEKYNDMPKSGGREKFRIFKARYRSKYGSYAKMKGDCLRVQITQRTGSRCQKAFWRHFEHASQLRFGPLRYQKICIFRSKIMVQGACPFANS